MSDDIGQDLYKAVKRDFDKKVNADSKIKRLREKIENKTATMDDVSDFATALGDHLADSIAANVTQGNLPEGRMYYNIADKILTPMLKGNHELINSTAVEVQHIIDNKIGISLNPVTAAYDVERMHHIINSASQDGIAWETVKRRLDSPVRNATYSMYTDYVKANADVRNKIGLDSYIIRADTGRCCEWCSRIAGKYRYPEDVDEDIFRRHDNCRCTVSFRNEKISQNVWTKEVIEQDKLEARKEASSNSEPKRFSTAQAKENESKAIEKLIDNSGESGIIYLRDNNDLYKHVTQESIDRVPKLDIFDDDQMNIRHQQAAKDLLTEVMKHDYLPVGTEFSIRYNKNMELVNKETYLQGEVGGVFISDLGEPFHAFHNHGSGETLSYTDIMSFISTKNAISITAVGNSGSNYCLMKMRNSNTNAYLSFLNNKAKEDIFSANGVVYSVKKIYDRRLRDVIKAEINKLAPEKISELQEALKNKIEECLKGGEKYGIRYKSFT